MIVWWVCVILCFVSAGLGLFLAALCNARREADVCAACTLQRMTAAMRKEYRGE